MPQTIRAKLIAIVGTAGLAFIVLLIVGTLLEGRIDRELTGIREVYLPRLELGPKLRHDFERLTRGIQDAAAAQDLEALAATRAMKDALLQNLDRARAALPASDLSAVHAAIEDYYTSASEVARRLIGDETGEAIVDAMARMQAKQERADKLLAASTAFDQAELARAFTSAARAQAIVSRTRLFTILSCMLLVIALAFFLGRSVLRSLGELEAGLQRFGRGELDVPIRVSSRDELGLLADQANHMAQNLLRHNLERDRADWLKEGHAGLTRELRGELEPDQVATRAIRFLCHYLDAPLGAVYAAQNDGSFKLLASHGIDTAQSAVDSFESGQGLVGQAALEPDVTVVGALPQGYLRLRSGLGEGQPHAIALAPLALLDRTIGVLELAVLKPWTDLQTDLLRSVRETATIALEVARARSALRELLEQTQQQADRLAAQEEELRSTNDELRAQQEELQAQQGELRETNEALTTQSAELLQQRGALERKNDELAEARLRLEHKAHELTTVSAYKSQFLANMSHELRTPLNSMLLLSNLLAQNEGNNLTARQVEFCKTIHGAGTDLLALINQVLDLAKIESGKQEATVSPIQVSELAARVERIFGPLAHDKGLALTVQLASSTPETIVSDRQRIEQILNNLVGNAIKFTESGSVAVSIGPPAPELVIQRRDLDRARTLAIVVEDTGIGVAPQHQESIFAPFEQVDGRPDRRYGGTGLGLSISRQLAELLGGELQLRSSPGTGSTFTCLLPYAAPPPKVIAPIAVTTPPKAANGRPVQDDRKQLAPGDPHLLLVEDDSVFAEIVGEVIHAQGLKYVIASDGASALRLAKERKPSGIILDVKLPDVDGFAVMERLRAEPETEQTPVHFISALEAGERGMALGAVGYLTKPASRNDIVRVVQSLVPKKPDAVYRVLIVEDEAGVADSLAQRLRGDEIEMSHASDAHEALALLEQQAFGCMVLDLSLPDMDGLELLRVLRERGGVHAPPPVIVYTGRPLSKAETQDIEAYAEAVVLKDGPSTERVLDEIRLFARRLKAGLPAMRRAPATQPPIALRLEGKTLLLVDDDMRTVYALSAVLRAKGANVLMADTGRAALELLGAHPEVDIVLMDIMMPEMDGYEAIRQIRQDARFVRLPIIALTAKAMKGDRERCLEIGASDYLPKPIDPDALTSILHHQLKPAVAHGV